MKSLRSITLTEKSYEVIADADFAGKRLFSADGQSVLKQCFGGDLSFNVSLESSAKTIEKNRNPQEVAKEKLKEAKEDVAVQSALKALKGTITETKVIIDGDQ